MAGILTVVGAVFVFHGLRVFGRTRRFVAVSASAKGTVTDSVGRWHRNPGDTPGSSRLSHPVVRFVTQEGRTVEFESQVGSNLSPGIGQEVTVIYDPLNPQDARISSFMMLWALPAVFTVLGVLLLVPGALLLCVLLLLLAL